MTTEAVRGAHFLESLDRGLQVLTSFDAEHTAMSLSDVAARTDMSPATARRILLTLVDLGYVRKRDRLFSLSPRVLDLGFSFLAGLDIVGTADVHMRDLSREIEESVLLAVLDGEDVRYIARAHAPRTLHLAIPVGERSPAHVTSAGRMLVANLSESELDRYLAYAEIRPYTQWTVTDRSVLRDQLIEARERGWAYSASELDIGMAGVAVLVPGQKGEPTALSTVFPASRFAEEDIPAAVVEPLRAHAQAIARDARRF